MVKSNLNKRLVAFILGVSQIGLPISVSAKINDNISALSGSQMSEESAERKLDLVKVNLEKLKLDNPDKAADIDNVIKFVEDCKREINEFVFLVGLMFQDVSSVNGVSFNEKVDDLNGAKSLLEKYIQNVVKVLNPEISKIYFSEETRNRYLSEVSFIEESLKYSDERATQILADSQKRFDDLSERIKEAREIINSSFNEVKSSFLVVSGMYDMFTKSMSSVSVQSESLEKLLENTMKAPTNENMTRLFKNYRDGNLNPADKMNVYRHMLALSNRGNKLAFRFLEVANQKAKSDYSNELLIPADEISEELQDKILEDNKNLNEEFVQFLNGFFGVNIKARETTPIQNIREGHFFRPDLLVDVNNDMFNPYGGPYGFWFCARYDYTTTQRGGWKIHISAQPESATKIAKIVIPYLEENDISYKIVASLDSLRSLNMRSVTQEGKFIAIYTRNNAEARKITTDLNRVISEAMERNDLHPRDFCELIGDLKIGNTGAIYARCGSFEGGDDFSCYDNRWTPLPSAKIMSGIVEKRKEEFDERMNAVKDLEDKPERNEGQECYLEFSKKWLEKNKLESIIDLTFPFDLDVSFLGQKLENNANVFESYGSLLESLSKKPMIIE